MARKQRTTKATEQAPEPLKVRIIQDKPHHIEILSDDTNISIAECESWYEINNLCKDKGYIVISEHSIL